MSGPVAIVLRALGLGDFLTGIPALKMVRRALPAHEIVLVAPEVLAPLVLLVPEVDNLYARGELEPLTGYGRLIDVGIDLHGNGPASRRLLQELNPRRVLGFADPVAGLTGPRWRPDEHEVTRWCRLVAEGFSLPPQGSAAWPAVPGSLTLPEESTDVAGGTTVVHPGAAAGSRRWPPDRFAAVAAALADCGHRVVVTGGGAEAGLAAHISRTAGVQSLTGLSLSQLARLIGSARLVICGDTGIAHLASAYSTPSVLLFGPVSPKLWGPPADRRHTVLWHGDGTGDPHGADPDPALLEITVAEVLEAVATTERQAGPVAPARLGGRGEESDQSAGSGRWRPTVG